MDATNARSYKWRQKLQIRDGLTENINLSCISVGGYRCPINKSGELNGLKKIIVQLEKRGTPKLQTYKWTQTQIIIIVCANNFLK